MRPWAAGPPSPQSKCFLEGENDRKRQIREGQRRNETKGLEVGKIPSRKCVECQQMELRSPKYLCVSLCVIQKPGCDSILGSEQQEDACMVCGGQNTTCLHHRSVYQSNRLEAGRINTHSHTHAQAIVTLSPWGINCSSFRPAGSGDNSRLSLCY